MKACARIAALSLLHIVSSWLVLCMPCFSKEARADIAKDIHFQVVFAKPPLNRPDHIYLHARFTGRQKGFFSFLENVGIHIVYYNAFGMPVGQQLQFFATSASGAGDITPISPLDICLEQQGNYLSWILQHAPSNAAYAEYRYICICRLMQAGVPIPEYQNRLISVWSPKIFLPEQHPAISPGRLS